MALTESEELELIEYLEEELRDEKRLSHLEFMKHTWMKTIDDPFVVGFHTDEICKAIDESFEKLRHGESSYYIVNVHHRAGKSDIVSRYLAPHFLGEFPDKEIIQTSYKAELAATFSTFGRNVFRSDKYKELYPNIDLSIETNKKNDWVIVDKNTKKPTGGKLYATGLNSGLTGNGFSLGAIDDWFAGRAEAESTTIRNRIWEAFTNDFMTRRAPASIVFIIGTLWHWDGLAARIRNEMKKNPDFPRFKDLIFPAKREQSLTPEKYPGKYLFLERYNEGWYREQYATLGRYGSAALLDCDPTMRTGGLLSTIGIVYHEKDDIEIPSETDIQWGQVWDLAHTKKQRTGDDPDYTSGTLLGFEKRESDPIPHLWIKKVSRCRKGAKGRDEFIRIETLRAGKFVKSGIESSIESKDAYEYIRAALPEYNWHKINITGGDKTVRIAPLEPIFETENHVHLVRGDWNDDWIEEITRFDGSGAGHDDQVDNLSAGYIMLYHMGMKLDNNAKAALAARRK